MFPVMSTTLVTQVSKVQVGSQGSGLCHHVPQCALIEVDLLERVSLSECKPCCCSPEGGAFILLGVRAAVGWVLWVFHEEEGAWRAEFLQHELAKE